MRMRSCHDSSHTGHSEKWRQVILWLELCTVIRRSKRSEDSSNCESFGRSKTNHTMTRVVRCHPKRWEKLGLESLRVIREIEDESYHDSSCAMSFEKMREVRTRITASHSGKWRRVIPWLESCDSFANVRTSQDSSRVMSFEKMTSHTSSQRSLANVRTSHYSSYASHSRKIKTCHVMTRVTRVIWEIEYEPCCDSSLASHRQKGEWVMAQFIRVIRENEDESLG